MTTSKGPPPTKDTFNKTARLLDDFFKVDEYRGTFERYNNEMSEEQRLLVFERGDSAAALLFDPGHNEVILTEQFRLPVKLRDERPWLLEVAAGIIDKTPKETILHEIREETGYNVSEVLPIATFFVSPGGSTERIHLFYAEVRRTQQIDAGGGLKQEGEDIRIVRMPLREFFTKLRQMEFQDAKLIIAAQWLRERLDLLKVPHMKAAITGELPPPVERRVKINGASAESGGRATPGKVIGYYTGDIFRVKDIDVWVNPLDTSMLLDKFSDRTVSARIRTLGADKYQDKRIKHDTIGEELRRAMGGRNFVAPATAIGTSSGQLKRSHGVKCIYHVATIEGEIGEAAGETDGEPGAPLHILERCVHNVLKDVDYRGKFGSVLFPMLGTGEGGLPLTYVAPRLLGSAISFLQSHPNSAIERIYFLPYTEVDAEALEDALKKFEEQLYPL